MTLEYHSQEGLYEPCPASIAVVVGFIFPSMLVELEAVAVHGDTRALDPP